MVDPGRFRLLTRKTSPDANARFQPETIVITLLIHPSIAIMIPVPVRRSEPRW